jgi:hypothetical protein
MKNTQELSVVAKVWNIRKTDFGSIWPSVLAKEIKSAPKYQVVGVWLGSKVDLGDGEIRAIPTIVKYDAL